MPIEIGRLGGYGDMRKMDYDLDGDLRVDTLHIDLHGLPQYIDKALFEVVSGTWVYGTITGQTKYHYGWCNAENNCIINPLGVDLNELKIPDLKIKAGKWKFTITTAKAANCGKIELLYGETQILLTDLYNATLSVDLVTSGVLEVRETSVEDLRIRVNGKHASSTSYVISICSLKVEELLADES